MATKSKASAKEETRKSSTPPDENPSPTLHRSNINRVIAGVCGGIGEYFNIDPTIIRIFFILITVFGGSGILIYLILWLVMPSSESSEISEKNIKQNAYEIRDHAQKVAHSIRSSVKSNSQKNNKWWAIFLSLFGVILLLNNFGFYDYFEIRKLWPIILVIVGLFILLRK